MRILALDVGAGTVTSAILNTETPQPVGSTRRVEYAIDRPTNEAAEVPAGRLWTAVSAAARGVAQAEDGIEGIGLSVLTPALVLIDDKDQPAAPIRLPEDRRSRPAARQVQAECGDAFLAEAGSRPLPGGTSAVAFRQIVTDDPYLIREVRRYLHLNSWLALLITGETAFDPANAALSGLSGTLTTGQWSPRWCEYFEVEPAWLPPIVDGSATVGTVRSAIAAELGVPAGLPVKLGTSQICTAMLGAEVATGDLFHSIEETQTLATLTEKPSADYRRLVFRLGVGNRFVCAAYNPVGGAPLSWLHALCFRDQTEKEFHERTIPLALERSTRVTLDPPSLAGDCLEIEARRAAFRDLTLQTDRIDLLAALLHEMRRQHERAQAALGSTEPWRRVLLVGKNAAMVQPVLPGYDAPNVQLLPEDPWAGIARLFQR
ncbi:MAG TPA: FGGY family carbohydrate kinase [Gemmataceae bacterium]|nr:FGGY family carbohydrate kinase [Gemmataceae bacterium]